jgi:carbonic anhydrase
MPARACAIRRGELPHFTCQIQYLSDRETEECNVITFKEVVVSNRVFGTAINCMDGRVQIPVTNWLKSHYGVDYVDMITEPGPVRFLAEGKDPWVVASIRRRLEVSVNRHKSELVAVVGHHDCAGNPVPKETQLEQILAAIKVVRGWDFKVRVTGLWVNENWEVQEVN